MKHLLIIEDDEVNCILYEEILCNDTLQIDFAYDGQQGLDRFKEKSYDLILLDLGLPRISGLEVARIIRELEENLDPEYKTPVIIITANNFPGTQLQAKEAGADGYLTKPFEIEHLQSMVTTYLQKKSGTLI